MIIPYELYALKFFFFFVTSLYSNLMRRLILKYSISVSFTFYVFNSFI